MCMFVYCYSLLAMCDLLQSEIDGQIIQTNACSKTNILNEASNEDENAKDAAPEVVGKIDAGSKIFKELLLKIGADLDYYSCILFCL